ncbi:glycosyltransferase [Niameybacter massiliensis]|uniref:Glycosyltransferase n=1 Tax=Holtiella tumoricola TaxID=3018743 RepID=A0AA42J2A6_9FIRM|nr:glycosyltransferase [Holtiella tumoricola]MDA3733489.1 glycosyltransferase [Holtiella tumoricola]
MRIAMLTNNYKPFIAGVPISVERLSNSLREQGHEVYVFAPTYKNQVEEEGVIRYRSCKKTLDSGAVVPYIFDLEVERKFKALDIDVIHVHHPNFIGWMGRYLGKKYNVPVVYTYHTRYEQYIHHIKGFDKLDEMSKQEDTLFAKHIASGILKVMREKVVPKVINQYTNQCDMVFAPTALMKDLLLKEGIKASVEILPTGLNEQFFEEDVQKSHEIRQHYIGEKKYLFCTVSRLDKEKNIEFIIEGLEKLKQKIGDVFRLLIIGEGALKERLQQMVKALGLETNVVFLNSIPNEVIKNYYSACDLFLFASKSETQGIVLLEAMAAKNPVVAIQASGVVEVVVNGMNGYMTGDNIEEWVDRILTIISDSDQFEALKIGAYDTAQAYSTAKVAERAVGYYQQAIYDHGSLYMRFKEGEGYKLYQI